MEEKNKPKPGIIKPAQLKETLFHQMVEKGRIAIWMIVAFSSILAVMGKIDSDTIKSIYQWCLVAAVGGETMDKTIKSKK